MPRIRIEIDRYTPKYKRTRSRQLRHADGRCMIIFEDSIADALAEIRTLRNAGAFDAPFNFKEARLYDSDAFNADPINCKPLRTVKEP